MSFFYDFDYKFLQILSWIFFDLDGLIPITELHDLSSLATIAGLRKETYWTYTPFFWRTILLGNATSAKFNRVNTSWHLIGIPLHFSTT